MLPQKMFDFLRLRNAISRILGAILTTVMNKYDDYNFKVFHSSSILGAVLTKNQSHKQ